MMQTELTADAYWFLAVMAFVVGTVCGSFFNVCIYRVPAGRSIVTPPSHCYACGTRIAAYDNIPLLSYLMLRGRCRHCGTRFSARYFLVELLCGLLYLWAYLRFGPSLVLLGHFAFIGLLVVGTFTDIDHFIIPDGVTLGGLWLSIGLAFGFGDASLPGKELRALIETLDYLLPELRAVAERLGWASSGVYALLSAAFGWVLLWSIGFLGRLMFRKEAMGGGDIKLFAFLGAYLGAVNCLYVLMLSTVSGALIGSVLLLTHKFAGRDEVEELALALPADPPMAAPAGNTETLASEHGPAGEPPPIVLRIARKTSRQLHHFPFGPYIAVAAILVLMFSEELIALTGRLIFVP
ncbi:MAG: prepilin peptidase [Candidatus Sumerlaeaceae bacterium]|nr:prepilin peptidase [Candidatus Sumerlaeaceae bacterium]